jgi:hypothetical protein
MRGPSEHGTLRSIPNFLLGGCCDVYLNVRAQMTISLLELSALFTTASQARQRSTAADQLTGRGVQPWILPSAEIKAAHRSRLSASISAGSETVRMISSRTIAVLRFRSR